jgi:HEPN domain-containing protein
MSELTAEWIAKAEADARTAERESHATDGPTWDAVCFQARQAAEKYLKAALQGRGTSLPRTCDLALLLQLLDWLDGQAALQDQAEGLTAFAVGFRYPGDSVSPEAAVRALEAMTTFRHHLRRFVGLGPP